MRELNALEICEVSGGSRGRFLKWLGEAIAGGMLYDQLKSAAESAWNADWDDLVMNVPISVNVQTKTVTLLIDKDKD
ncbi:hypothetical protein [Pseudoalteromonas piratica]|uniref:Uncharacterized protein n=1 Tax=Pseudoalteromonas piratica TaxID=1348114 RepID=A0A0A7EBE8_9GAMM|nr:hypothetical protein [Pseudoalteromonas piratica]AIY63945.1 hypothetical protein OM33_01330 [Pseudoalteromonas piratica]